MAVSHELLFSKLTLQRVAINDSAATGHGIFHGSETTTSRRRHAFKMSVDMYDNYVDE